MKQIVDVIEHTTYTGWLWWRKAHTRQYYLQRGLWRDVQNHQTVDSRLQKKLTRVWQHADKFRV